MRMAFSTPGSEVLLRADPHRLQQVFINLALNAFRAMSGGGALQVSVQSGDTPEELPVRVVFRDHGVGIPSRYLAKIFEAGFTTIAGSPGLGLALAKKVVEQHQGKISVESDSEKGTAFTLSFPRAEVVNQPGIVGMSPAPRDRLLAV
jgi:signal transduction histidine kinase